MVVKTYFGLGEADVPFILLGELLIAGAACSWKRLDRVTLVFLRALWSQFLDRYQPNFHCPCSLA